MKILLAMLIVTTAVGLIWFANQTDEFAEAPESTQLPVISRTDILHATDLASGVKLAVEENDPEAIEEWLEKAIDLALVARLSKQDIDYLRSDRARKYVIFHAKRSLFNDAVEQAYYAIYDIESIKAQYPQALSLFSDADKLIADRNFLIQQIATELSNGEQLDDEILLQAKHHWRQRFAPIATIPGSGD